MHKLGQMVCINWKNEIHYRKQMACINQDKMHTWIKWHALTKTNHIHQLE